ncbi:hypothetical protein TEA_027554 [Camellia sinensis var. sinensis]|uniref:Uncharacterized protein n=1 Tax=Camellia sinensis var. sinensis TaxID=542762 RepID=A0A4S4D3L1_CAMSN|nr:hypothetical protein TEA_027554 [Camellia sinensis var. sinensis]
MVTLKASYMVKPAKETPTRLMYLSEFDQFDTITHSPTVYFYQQSGELILNAIIHTLKDSLSKALIMFYPLAGRLQWIARGRLQHDHLMKCGGKWGKWPILLYWKDSSLADSNRMNWVVPVPIQNDKRTGQHLEIGCVETAIMTFGFFPQPVAPVWEGSSLETSHLWGIKLSRNLHSGSTYRIGEFRFSKDSLLLA